MMPKVAESLHKYKHITPITGLNNHLLVVLRISISLPPPPEARVTRLAPDDTGAVLNPRYMLLDIIYNRAKP